MRRSLGGLVALVTTCIGCASPPPPDTRSRTNDALLSSASVTPAVSDDASVILGWLYMPEMGGYLVGDVSSSEAERIRRVIAEKQGADSTGGQIVFKEAWPGFEEAYGNTGMGAKPTDFRGMYVLGAERGSEEEKLDAARGILTEAGLHIGSNLML